MCVCVYITNNTCLAERDSDDEWCEGIPSYVRRRCLFSQRMDTTICIRNNDFKIGFMNKFIFFVRCWRHWLFLYMQQGLRAKCVHTGKVKCEEYIKYPTESRSHAWRMCHTACGFNLASLQQRQRVLNNNELVTKRKENERIHASIFFSRFFLLLLKLSGLEQQFHLLSSLVVFRFFFYFLFFSISTPKTSGFTVNWVRCPHQRTTKLEEDT